jgi:3-oxoacyl-[acyl-carrier-protein] synthase-3
MPETVRRNDHFRALHPEIVEFLSRKAAGAAPPAAPPGGPSLFDLAMMPYLEDPFRGTVERRALGPGGSARDLELPAARSALGALGMAPGEVDLLIASSLIPDQLAVGNAVFLARDLGIGGAAWNLESACVSAFIGLSTAAALVQAGQHDNVLVVVSGTYTRDLESHNPLAWTVGDAAAAFVVGEVPTGFGLLGQHTMHTASTCGAFFHEMVAGADGKPRIRLDGDRAAAQRLKDASEPCLRACVAGALESAELTLADIDFFVFNTPMAWFCDFARRVIGFDPSKTLDGYPLVANIGPALTPTNLYLAAKRGLIKPGDRVLCYGLAGSANAAAAVIRWGETALGPEVPGLS